MANGGAMLPNIPAQVKYFELQLGLVDVCNNVYAIGCPMPVAFRLDRNTSWWTQVEEIRVEIPAPVLSRGLLSLVYVGIKESLSHRLVGVYKLTTPLPTFKSFSHEDMRFVLAANDLHFNNKGLAYSSMAQKHPPIQRLLHG